MQQLKSGGRIAFLIRLCHQFVIPRAIGLVIVVAVVGTIHGKEGERIGKVCSPSHAGKLEITGSSLCYLYLLLLCLKLHLDAKVCFPLCLQGLCHIAVELEARVFVGDGREAFSIRVTGLCQKLFCLVRIKADRIFLCFLCPVLAACGGFQMFCYEEITCLIRGTARGSYLIAVDCHRERLADADIVKRCFIYIKQYVVACHGRRSNQLIAVFILVHNGIIC